MTNTFFQESFSTRSIFEKGKKAKFGWRDVENFHHEEISSFQHMRRMANCRHMYKYRWHEWKEGRKHHSERPQE